MKLTPQEKQTIEAYDSNAAVWAASRNRENDWKEEKETFHTLLPSGRVVEIGSGSGRDAKDLIAIGYDYIGTDVSKGLLEQAKNQNPQAIFLEQSVYDLQFPQNSFDGFWACAVLLHIPKKRIVEALASIHRIIKKGGIGFISLKMGDGERFVIGDHVGISYKRFFSFWKQNEFIKVLKDNDFEVIQSYELEHIGKPWLVFFVKVRKD